jgi:hypothetical protein
MERSAGCGFPWCGRRGGESAQFAQDAKCKRCKAFSTPSTPQGTRGRSPRGRRGAGGAASRAAGPLLLAWYLLAASTAMPAGTSTPWPCPSCCTRTTNLARRSLCMRARARAKCAPTIAATSTEPGNSLPPSSPALNLPLYLPLCFF